MGNVIKWVGFIAAILAIITFVIDLFTGWPINPLLIVWNHRLVRVESTDEFHVEAICTSSGRAITPPDKFSYKFHVPLNARGTTSFSESDHIWVVLRDEHGGYYLQNSAVTVSNGQWNAYNIRPLAGIKQIVWLKVDEAGNDLFIRKRNHNEWNRFVDLPTASIKVAHAELQ